MLGLTFEAVNTGETVALILGRTIWTDPGEWFIPARFASTFRIFCFSTFFTSPSDHNILAPFENVLRGYFIMEAMGDYEADLVP